MSEPDLISGYDALLADLDGVVYAGAHAIDGAVDALDALAPAGVRLAYVTNNASRSAAEVAEHVRSLGAPATASQVFGSALAGAELLATLVPTGAPVLVIGSATLADAVSLQGLVPLASARENPAAVIQGFSPAIGWTDLAEASYAVAAGAVWVATNTDLTIPQARGIAPGNGSLVAAVTAATGKHPVVAGKPEAPLFLTAAAHLGARRALVVGDRLDTDILGGNRACMDTALVLTGVDSAQTALAAVTAQRPSYLLTQLGELHAPYPPVLTDSGSDSDSDSDTDIDTGDGGGHSSGGIRAIVRDGGGHSSGGIRAIVRDGVVLVDGPESSIDAWRAACAAWWHARPDVETAYLPKVRFTAP